MRVCTVRLPPPRSSQYACISPHLGDRGRRSRHALLWPVEAGVAGVGQYACVYVQSLHMAAACPMPAV